MGGHWGWGDKMLGSGLIAMLFISLHSGFEHCWLQSLFQWQSSWTCLWKSFWWLADCMFFFYLTLGSCFSLLLALTGVNVAVIVLSHPWDKSSSSTTSILVQCLPLLDNWEIMVLHPSHCTHFTVLHALQLPDRQSMMCYIRGWCITWSVWFQNNVTV